MCHFGSWITLSSGQIKTKRLRKNFNLPFNCLKGSTQRAWSRKRTITRGNYKEYGQGVGTWKGLEIKFLSVSHGLYMAWQTPFTNHLLCPPSCKLPFSPFKSQAATPSPQLRMACKPQLPACLLRSLRGLLYILIKFVFLLLMSSANLIDQPEEPKRIEETLPPLQISLQFRYRRTAPAVQLRIALYI